MSKYINWYNNIISNAKLLNRNKKISYYENHHIIPSCVGGHNDKSNKVLLTAKEHFICHHLLTKIYNDDKLHFAFWSMCNQKNEYQDRSYKITSIIYENSKKQFSLRKSISQKGKIPFIHTDETKKALSERMKNNNPGKLPHTRELSSQRGKILFNTNNPMNSQISREKVRQSKLGNKNPNFKGYYITPWGKFASSNDAIKNSPFNINDCGTISSWCKNNTKLISTRKYFREYKGQGKTYKDIGFSFIE